MAPDLRRKVDANRAAGLAQENATKRQQAAQVRVFYTLEDHPQLTIGVARTVG